METFFEADPDDQDRHFEAIGRVVVATGYLDDALSTSYAAMLGSEVGMLVAAGQGFDIVVRACRAIQRELGWHPSDDEFDRVLGEAKRLYEARNEVIHGLWFGLAGSASRATYRKRRWVPHPNGKNWTVEELQDLANDIGRSAFRVWTLGRRSD